MMSLWPTMTIASSCRLDALSDIDGATFGTDGLLNRIDGAMINCNPCARPANTPDPCPNHPTRQLANAWGQSRRGSVPLRPQGRSRNAQVRSQEPGTVPAGSFATCAA